METPERKTMAGRPESMGNFALPPMKTIRVVITGIGNRSLFVVKRVSWLPVIVNVDDMEVLQAS